MAKLPILQYPHPKLAAKAEPVADFNDAIKTLVNDMAETMYAAPGVGLAANQVGILKRIVVIDITDDNSDLLVLSIQRSSKQRAILSIMRKAVFHLKDSMSM